jgi:hypothetical protein
MSISDPEALTALDRKLRLVDDRVAAVVHGYQTGLYLYGAGGMGKSYGVLGTLRNLSADFRLFNSRMTGKGLFRALERAPAAVHVLEDMERLTGDRDGQGVLRAALWAQPGREREVTWTTGDGESRFSFGGGIIMLANRPLNDLPELRALATRIAVHRLEISDPEMTAQLRRIAQGGFTRTGFANPDQVEFNAEGGFVEKGPTLESPICSEICQYVINECKDANCPLDLRLYDNSCLDYLQWQAGDTHCHWHDLVSTRVRQCAAHFRHQVDHMGIEERKQQQRQIVREICSQIDDPQERLRRWQDVTGASKNTFYRRKAEFESGEFEVAIP